MSLSYNCEEYETIYILTDVPAYAGVGAYAWSLFKLLSASYPCLKIYFMDVHGIKIPNEGEHPPKSYKSNIWFDVPLKKWLTYRKFANTQLNKNSNVHLCGVDYSIVSKLEKTIITVHDIFYRKPKLSLVLTNPYEFATETLIDSFIPLNIIKFRQTKALVSNSEVVRDDLLKKYSLNSNLIDIWIDEEKFKLRDKDEIRSKLILPCNKKILLNVSGPGVNKNLTTLERIASSLGEDYILLKIGSLVRNPKIINLGTVSEELYPLYFSASDIYLNTSTDEGFGIPLIEALGSGLPVVSPKVSTFPYILGDSAAYVSNPFDKNEYIRMIDFVFENHLEFSIKARTRSKRFSSEIARQKYEKLYSEIFGLHPVRKL
jgi:glycosyltransferase involved in cell wall biosynthesis